MTRRKLSDDEHALWRGVTRSIKPMRPRAEPPIAPPAPAVVSLRPARPKPAAAAVMARPPGPPPLAPLGRRFRQRLSRGTEAIEQRLDLHGLTQAQAHHALLRFLRESHRHGLRTVLVITGKGEISGERGVLKRQVPMWLGVAEFRAYVVGFEDAGRRHGGEGALYVRLRRPRES
jgi:DNA-nicking Smr family endonuclease